MAAVATLCSGANPADVDIRFTITGSIDGPSAGGILTVGILAALDRKPLLPGVTMTGTISPDGSIGPISGAPTKIEAASAAGYTTVLLPVQNMKDKTSSDGEASDMVAYGAKFGVAVKPVRTIAEAYEALTGASMFAAASQQYSMPAPVAVAGAATASALIARIEDELSVAPLPADRIAAIAHQADQARTALSEGDPATAYGVAADAYQLLVKGHGEAQAKALIARDGLESAKRRLFIRIDESLAQAQALVISASDVSDLGLEQQLSMPTALGWVTYAEATLQALRQSTRGGFDEFELLSATRVLAEERAALDVFFPDALTVLHAMPSRDTSGDAKTVAFVSGYTNFLVRAGEANEAYLKTVLRADGSGSDPQNALPGDLSLTTLQLSGEAAEIPLDVETADAEVAQSVRAIRYFVVSSSAVSSLQALGLYGLSAAGEETIGSGDSAALAASIGVGKRAIDSLAARLQEQGLDAGYAVWSASWGAASADFLQGDERSPDAALQSLYEIWYSSINVSIINAANAGT